MSGAGNVTPGSTDTGTPVGLDFTTEAFERLAPPVPAKRVKVTTKPAETSGASVVYVLNCPTLHGHCHRGDIDRDEKVSEPVYIAIWL